MKAAVVGLGSMGRRRMRLARAIDPAIELIGIDSNTARAAEVAQEFEIATVSSLEEAFLKSPDCVLICTSPLSHASLLQEVLGQGIPAFTELNLVSTNYDQFILKAEEKKLFLSSTFLYRKDVRYIIEACQGKKLHYVYHSGQYLPDWHPWENFKDFFVGDKRTNGCREIFAIELPWLIACFGPVTSLEVRRDTLSNLNLDYPDAYQLIVEHESGSRGVFSVDVVSRIPSRRFETYGGDMHLRWEGAPDTLVCFNLESREIEPISLYENVNQDGRYAPNIIEDAYEDELRAFFAWVSHDDRRGVRYGFSQDAYTLALIDKIEGEL
ncbi:MAG: Gfo/Idh/MocA family oxidoreductase [Raoultibacter sp.]